VSAGERVPSAAVSGDHLRCALAVGERGPATFADSIGMARVWKTSVVRPGVTVGAVGLICDTGRSS
jgi:hypothetical protein